MALIVFVGLLPSAATLLVHPQHPCPWPTAPRPTAPRRASLVVSEAEPPTTQPPPTTEPTEPKQHIDPEKLALVERAGDPFRAVRVVLYATFGIAGIAGVGTSLLQVRSDSASAMSNLAIKCPL